MPDSRVKQVIGIVLVALVLAWTVAGDRIQAALTPDRHGCAHSADLPRPGNREEARAAVLCLVNHERAKRDLPPLADDRRLQRAAQAHARAMGERDFYAHRDPDGREPDERIRAAGYDGSTTGENLLWGTGGDATPAEAVEGWMESPGHRANILRREFTRVGTGIAYDAPEPQITEPAAVYVHNFGG